MNTTNSSPVPGFPQGDLDWNAAMETVDGDTDLLKVVLEALLEECPQRVDDIRRALKVADLELLKRSAHSVKGNFRIFGSSELGKTANDLEVAAEAGDIERANALVAMLEPQVDSALTEVRMFLTSFA